MKFVRQMGTTKRHKNSQLRVESAKDKDRRTLGIQDIELLRKVVKGLLYMRVFWRQIPIYMLMMVTAKSSIMSPPNR